MPGRGDVPRAPGAARAGARATRRTWPSLESWMKSYRPEELFDERGRLARPSSRRSRRAGERRMGANPHANGGARPGAARPARLRARTRCAVERAGDRCAHESTRAARRSCCATSSRSNRGSRTSALFCPDETNSNRLGAVLRGREPLSRSRATIATDDHVSPRRPRDGGAERAQLRGLARGLPAHRPPRPLRDLRGVRADRRLDGHAARQVARDVRASCPGARRPVAQLLLTSTCWRNDHNGFCHQGPGFMDTIISKKGTVARVYLPPDANCLLSVADHCLRSRNYVNLIIIDKQPQLQWLDIDAAREHCARGASDLGLGRHRRGATSPTWSSPAPATSPPWRRSRRRWWLRKHAPGAPVRVVNVVDLMSLFAAARASARHARRRGSSSSSPATRDVVFAFHGYPGASTRHPARPAQRRALPRARLPRGGHDHHAVRHGRAQRDEPLPPRASRRCGARAGGRRTPTS